MSWPAAAEATRRTCDAYREAIARGTNITQAVAWLAGVESVTRPTIWRRLRAGGVLPPYGQGKPLKPHKRRSHRQIEEEQSVKLRVDRDPCPRCGVRGDVVCGHSKAPLGMVL